MTHDAFSAQSIIQERLTPLHVACSSTMPSVKTIEILLKAGAEVNCQDKVRVL